MGLNVQDLPAGAGYASHCCQAAGGFRGAVLGAPHFKSKSCTGNVNFEIVTAAIFDTATIGDRSRGHQFGGNQVRKSAGIAGIGLQFITAERWLSFGGENRRQRGAG